MLKVAAASCALALILVCSIVVSGCSQESKQTIDGNYLSTASPIEVPLANVSLMTDTYKETKTKTEQIAEYKLPNCSQVWASSDSCAAVLTATGKASPLMKASILDLSDGTLYEVLPEATQKNADIEEVRCTDEAIAWTEVNEKTQTWTLFMASLDSTYNMGKKVKLGEGNTTEYDEPQFCITGSTVIWEVMPNADGAKSEENSYVYKQSTGDKSPTVMLVSPGRLATAPVVSDGVLTIVPRVDDDGIYYSLVAIDIKTDEILERMDLEASMKPHNAIYQDGAFTFAFEATYDVGEGIAEYGTYIQTGKNTFTRFARIPLDTAAKCGAYTIIKSTTATIWINTEKSTYFTLMQPDGSADYGDYLATEGECSKIVTFATIESTTVNDDNYVLVRVFDLK